jgi:hypothetical protein
LTVPQSTSTINTVMTTTYPNTDQAYEAGTEWIRMSDRHEKLDFLMETASPEFKDNLINELINFIHEDDMDKFFKHLRKTWCIKTPPELDYEMNN